MSCNIFSVHENRNNNESYKKKNSKYDLTLTKHYIYFAAKIVNFKME